ncbi:MAG: VWA domain-containing protein [Spirochaetaceae bacterium]|nr:MAG: VWA domain-containing protein [Spirochaetaceae bacterium]
MTVEYPALLGALLILVPVVGLQVRAFVLGRRDLLIVGAHLDPVALSSLYLVKSFLTAFAFDVFVVFSILAMAGISWGQVSVEEDRSGLDVVVSIDVSRSMLAADIEPSRLDRAAALVRTVVRDLPLARFAVTVFKGSATTLMPLTSDPFAVEIALEGLTPALVSTPGTNIEVGLAHALNRFPSASSAHRAVILVSDGEALAGDARGPAARAKDLGIPVFTVLTGTAEGAVIPAPDGSPLTDEAGRPRVSRADPAMLESIALATGGRAFLLTDPDAVPDLIREIGRFVDLRQREGFRLVPHRRYRLFLGVALAALAVSLILRIVRWQRLF